MLIQGRECLCQWTLSIRALWEGSYGMQMDAVNQSLIPLHMGNNPMDPSMLVNTQSWWGWDARSLTLVGSWYASTGISFLEGQFAVGIKWLEMFMLMTQWCHCWEYGHKRVIKFYTRNINHRVIYNSKRLTMGEWVNFLTTGEWVNLLWGRHKNK